MSEMFQVFKILNTLGVYVHTFIATTVIPYFLLETSHQFPGSPYLSTLLPTGDACMPLFALAISSSVSVGISVVG
jgi:hypothetical protein